MYSWIDKEGVIPPGNGPEQDLWEVRVLHAGHFTIISLALYVFSLLRKHRLIQHIAVHCTTKTRNSIPLAMVSCLYHGC